jgi:hypothetical protein
MAYFIPVKQPVDCATQADDSKNSRENPANNPLNAEDRA